MSSRRSTVLVLAAAMVMLAMLVAPPVLAQTNPNGPTIPGAAGLGPPAWVKPGTRITFHNAAATVGGSPSVFVEDPNGPWQDPSTGKHYSMQESASSDTQGSGGDGVSQVDVVAIEGTDVVLSESGYAIDRLNGVHFIPGGAPSGGRLPGGQPGDTWVSPELLAGVVPSNLGGMLLLRGDFVLDGTTYQAVSLVRPDPTNYASYTYDTESGVLLAEDTQTQGTVPGTDPQVPSGDTFMTVTHLAGICQRDVPGLAGTNPEWVASTAGLTYSGAEAITNPLRAKCRRTDLSDARTRHLRAGWRELGDLHRRHRGRHAGRPAAAVGDEGRHQHGRAVLVRHDDACRPAARPGARPGSLDRRLHDRLGGWPRSERSGGDDPRSSAGHHDDVGLRRHDRRPAGGSGEGRRQRNHVHARTRLASVARDDDGKRAGVIALRLNLSKLVRR